jgi:hypothetical protein
VFRYLNSTKSLNLRLRPEKTVFLEASIDASYGVHKDYKSHSGVCVAIGAGVIFAKSTKQKCNCRSSTEAELIAASDGTAHVIGLRNFLTAQGEKMGPTKVQQDNMSTLHLLEKGKAACNHTRHVNIRYFWVRDQVEKGELRFAYTPTEDIVADILTKPLQGERFLKLRALLLNSQR